MIDSYLTIEKPASSRVTRKRSRFLGYVYPATSSEEIEELLSELKRSHHDSSHVCFAYRLMAEGREKSRADDAGEPAGSAGPSILRQLEAAKLYDVLGAVVRYFGGSKLGFGGLMRAYSDTMKSALDEAEIVRRDCRVRLQVRFPLELVSAVMRLVHRHGTKVESVDYDRDAQVVVSLAPSRLRRFTEELKEATGARAVVEEVA